MQVQSLWVCAGGGGTRGWWGGCQAAHVPVSVWTTCACSTVLMIHVQHCVKKVAFLHDIVDNGCHEFFVPYSAEFLRRKIFAFFEDQPPTSKIYHAKLF